MKQFIGLNKDVVTKFSSSHCENKFNLLNDELKQTITAGVETYTPRVIVLKSTCIYYTKQNLSNLLKIDGFIGIKRINSFGDDRTEIIFEK